MQGAGYRMASRDKAGHTAGLRLKVGGLREEGAMSRSLVVGGALRTERRPDGRRKLLRELHVHAGRHSIRVPSGFVTDFSSIPTCLHWLVRWSRVDVAGVVHDFLYARGTLGRWQADGVWYKVARSGEHRANLLQAAACWSALRLFGWFIWIRAANRHGRTASRIAARGVADKAKHTEPVCGPT